MVYYQNGKSTDIQHKQLCMVNLGKAVLLAVLMLISTECRAEEDDENDLSFAGMWSLTKVLEN